MSSFYVVYNISSSIPGSDCYSNTYEIYKSEDDFLDNLERFIEYAKSCLCDVDEDDDAEMDQWYEDTGFSQERYENYLRLIDEKRQNLSIDNGLYSKYFGEFDVEIDIVLTTTDYRLFIDKLHEDFSRRSKWVEDLDSDEKKEIYKEYPIMKYTALIKKRGKYPNKDTFWKRFADFEESVNEGALSLYV